MTSRSDRQRLGSNRLAHAVLMLGSLVMMFPFLWQLKMAFSSQAEIQSVPPDLLPAQLRWSNFSEVFQRLPFLDQFWVSIAVTVGRTVGQLVLCSMAGYAFARMSFRLKGVMLALILSILMVPSQVYLIPQYQIIQQLGWLDSIQGIVAPGVFSAFGTFLMMQFFKSIPAELEEAARLDGCNPWQTFWKVVLPVAKPGLISLAIITVLASWADLLWPLVVTSSPERMPLAVGLATLSGYQGTISPGVLMAAALMAMAPVLILFVVLQRRVVEGIAFSGLK
ncbi:binding-protein-dependent transport systems inner membrane component [Kribbella flavida DSM 17836]|uniref:Binding-protein-dependent transport systems inner membrane component n=1 Tax=Kribbella flavida (strain DSM 17836 / JCM 10339 / NBRC 14399) TaxID=479435 RepID=D2Q202_KRIFD|nr:carbohydrate ABC transporter permease [Kribbella flavida]ADB33948.1 binding-protein-dependent transport systems inner membrane component [Kribbella flavida DSM 17836]